MRRKQLLVLIAAMTFSIGATAQKSEEFYGLGNRIGIGVGVGTEGIGIDAATCLTKWCQARIGVNVMPGFSFNADADVSGVANTSYDGQNYEYPWEGDMEVEASLSRVMVDLKFDVYPFPSASTFFLTAGFSFGGNKLIKVTGHSDEFRSSAGALQDYGINIGEYRLPIDENGDVSGGVKVNGFRPYLGLGFGRLVPKKRVGFRFEMGVQFHGKIKAYADGFGDLRKVIEEEGDDDITEVMDKLTIYPVLKFSLRGRIF